MKRASKAQSTKRITIEIDKIVDTMFPEIVNNQVPYSTDCELLKPCTIVCNNEEEMETHRQRRLDFGNQNFESCLEAMMARNYDHLAGFVSSQILLLSGTGNYSLTSILFVVRKDDKRLESLYKLPVDGLRAAISIREQINEDINYRIHNH